MPSMKAIFVVLKAELTSKAKIAAIRKKKEDEGAKDDSAFGSMQMDFFGVGGTLDEEPPLAPWGWSHTSEFFKYPEGIDDPTYPIDGVRSMRRDHPAWKPYVKTESDWMALQDFFFKFESTLNDPGTLYAYTVSGDRNPVRNGAMIYGSLMNGLMKRANNNAHIDAKLRELGISPPQVYAHRGKSYPPRSKV